MLNIIFKNLQKSELARNVVTERFDILFEKFPDLTPKDLSVTLSMQNSKKQAGPDEFTVKVFCKTGRYKNILIEKSAGNLYSALADIVLHMLERLNRFGDKRRVKTVRQERQVLHNSHDLSQQHFEEVDLKY